MPDQQPISINEQKDNWDRLQRTLNYMFKDVYSILDEIQGRANKTFTPESIVLPAPPAITYSVHTHESDAQGGKIDHGDALDGKGDDDHTQYLLADGTRDAAKLDIGTGANYTEIKADGEINLHGTARVTVDMYITASGVKAPDANPATFIEQGLCGAWQFADQGVAANQESISGTLKLSTQMDKTVAPVFKIGWSANGVNPGNCEWQLEYLYRSPNEDTTAVAQATLTVTSTASATSDGLIIASFSALALPSSTDQAMFFKITRLSAGANDTIADTTEILGMLFNHTRNKLGVAT